MIPPLTNLGLSQIGSPDPADVSLEPKTVSDPKLQCRKPRCADSQIYRLAFSGDYQIHTPPYLRGVHRTPQIHYFAPGLRPEGAVLGVPFLMEELLRQNVGPIFSSCNYQGNVLMGDISDLASTEELNMFLHIYQSNPLFKSLFYVIGNHEIVHSGSFSAGNQINGAIGLAFNLQEKSRTYEKDIYGTEVGGEAKKLNKQKAVQFIYEKIFKIPFEPIKVLDAEEYGYTLIDQNEKKWKNSTQIVNDFWRHQEDGSWDLLIQYQPGNKDLKPEQQWIYTRAKKLVDLKTRGKDFPIYLIGLDSMDYTNISNTDGTTSGHVSKLQAKLIQKFIEVQKKENPNAKFILATHYPVSSMADSNLSAVLSDESVIFVMGAHTHQRNYFDLAHHPVYTKKYKIHRQTPLPEITVSPVIDYPHEMMILTYGVSKDQNLFFEAEYKGVNPQEIQGNSPYVDTEMDLIKPHLLTYDDAIVNAQDPRLQRIGTPGVPFLNQLEAFGKLDSGIITDSVRIPDLVIARAGIPAMIESMQLYLRLFTSGIKLTLMEAGLLDEAIHLEEAHLLNIEHFYAIYRHIIGKDGIHTDPAAIAVALDTYIDTLREQSREILAHMDQIIDHDDTPKWIKECLTAIRQPVHDMPELIDSYKRWLSHYALNRLTDRPESELFNQANLTGDPYFRRIMIQHFWRKLPPGSAARAFLVRVNLEAILQENKFYGALRQDRLPRELQTLRDFLTIFGIRLDEEIPGSRIIPDKIRINLSSKTGRIAFMTSLPIPLSPQETKALRHKLWSDPPVSEEFRQLQKTLGQPRTNKIEDHWMIKIGTSWGRGTSRVNGDGLNWSPRFELGGSWHLLNLPDRPRLNLSLSGGVDFDWEIRKRGFDDFNFDFPAKVAFTVGDPMGLIDVGPVFLGGLSMRHVRDDDQPLSPIAFVGAGGQVHIFEGALTLEGNYRHYFETGEKASKLQFGFSIDIVPLLSKALPVFFDIRKVY